ncbi:MAG: ATP-binding cassette domain-containing protein, partial [Burkholderiales bacterium]|nr:ATP-binding cassette domain-containing protein [Burkholderiales bacterium]
IVLGQLAPQSGDVRHGTKLEVAYFDQLRKPVSDDVTAIDVIGDGKEYLEIGGQARHVIGYLQDFLFTPDRARQPVRSLSGGERARLLLAQMFSKPSNVLVLDEPTNDLDIETLDLLEERLMEYTGTVLLVSHDREFINHIATRSWVIEGEGRIGDYVGGFEDWMRQRTSDPWANMQKTEKQGDACAAPAVVAPVAAPPKKKKLSFKDQRELDALPALIETLEKQQGVLTKKIGEPTFYQQDKDTVAKTQAELSKVNLDLEKAYARWEALEGPTDE